LSIVRLSWDNPIVWTSYNGGTPRDDAPWAEELLWAKLRSRQIEGVRFRRNYELAGFKIDFYAPGIKLAIETDGSQHDFSRAKDARRDEKLVHEGVTVMRFDNAEIEGDLARVVREIRAKVGELLRR
jgi:very-short-patch-repair endonuclease